MNNVILTPAELRALPTHLEEQVRTTVGQDQVIAICEAAASIVEAINEVSNAIRERPTDPKAIAEGMGAAMSQVLGTVFAHGGSDDHRDACRYRTLRSILHGRENGEHDTMTPEGRALRGLEHELSTLSVEEIDSAIDAIGLLESGEGGL